MQMRKRFGVVASLIVLLAFAAAGVAMAQEVEPVRGGTLRIGIPSDVKGLDPRLVTGRAEEEVWVLMFSTLATLNANMEPEPNVAKSWTVSDDGLEYTFYLREGVKFHNGDELTAEDVKYTYDQVRDPAFGSSSQGLFNQVKSIDVVDPYTVKFTLHDPYSDFLTASIAGPVGIVPKDYAEAVGLDEFNRAPVGSGPFKLVRHELGDKLVFERHEEYFKAGKPYLDRVEVVIIPEDAVRLIALENGEIDIVHRFLPVRELPRLEADPNINLLRVSEAGIFVIVLNVENPLLQDVRVRQAISYAIDREGMMAHVVQEGTPGHTAVIPDMWAYAPQTPRYTYDPAKARQLLAEAGYRNGLPRDALTLLGIADIVQYRNLATVVHQQLTQAGMPVKLELKEWTVMHGDMINGRFDIGLYGVGGMSTPDKALYRLHSTDPNNHGFYSNPEVDALLDEARRSSDQEHRAKLYAEVQRIVYEDAPWVFIGYREISAATGKDVHGYELYPLLSWLSVENTWKAK